MNDKPDQVITSETIEQAEKKGIPKEVIDWLKAKPRTWREMAKEYSYWTSMAITDGVGNTQQLIAGLPPLHRAEVMAHRKDCPVNLRKIPKEARGYVLSRRRDYPVSIRTLRSLNPADREYLLTTRKDAPFSVDLLKGMDAHQRARVMAFRPECPVNLRGLDSCLRVFVLAHRQDHPVTEKILSTLDPADRAQLIIARKDAPVTPKLMEGMQPLQRTLVMVERPDSPIDLKGLPDRLRAWIMIERPDCPIDLKGLPAHLRAWVMAERPDCPINLRGLTPRQAIYVQRRRNGPDVIITHAMIDEMVRKGVFKTNNWTLRDRPADWITEKTRTWAQVVYMYPELAVRMLQTRIKGIPQDLDGLPHVAREQVLKARPDLKKTKQGHNLKIMKGRRKRHDKSSK